MDTMTHAKFHFNRLMLTLIFGVWASEPPLPRPGERLKRPCLTGLSVCSWYLHNDIVILLSLVEYQLMIAYSILRESF